MFSMTNEGFLQAMEYLKSIDKLSEIDKEASQDGFTIVALANHYWKKNHDSN